MDRSEATVRRRLSNWFDLLVEPLTTLHRQAAWQPAADVYRCEHGWLVKLDLAGVRTEDVTIQIERVNVIVSGTRRDWRFDKRREPHSMEIAYSHFERCIELPEEIGAAETRTEYRDGMLLVHVLPQREADQ